MSGNLSYKISYQIVETKNELLNTGKSYEELAYEAEQIHYYVRKAAHMTEYCLLAVAVSFPFYVYRIRGLRLFLLAGIICVGFAGLDEYHQSFVAGRSPGIRDVGFDSLGALIGILLVQLFAGPPSTRLLPETKSAVKGGNTQTGGTWIFMFPRPFTIF